MNKIDKKFINDLNSYPIVHTYNHNLYIEALKSIFSNEEKEDYNYIDIQDFKETLDLLNYQGYQRGYLIYEILINNTKIINTEPYSTINIKKYYEKIKKYNVSIEVFINTIKLFVIEYFIYHKKINYQNLNAYEKDIIAIIQKEEENRLKRVVINQKIKEASENLNSENIKVILNICLSNGFSYQDINALHIYLNTLLNKQLIKEKEPLSLNLDLNNKSETKTYNMKELKQMEQDLTEMLKSIRKQKAKISLKEYLSQLKNILILESSTDTSINIDELYNALIIDENTYPFLEAKAQSFLQTNLAIEVNSILEDINQLKEIIKNSKEEEKNEYKIMLNEIYTTLYHHNYERNLKL